MISSRQINAQDFKDSYVNALIESGAMDTAPALIIPTSDIGEIAGAFEDRMVEPTPNNPYGFPEEIRGGDNWPENFGSWDEGKKGAFMNLPHVDI